MKADKPLIWGGSKRLRRFECRVVKCDEPQANWTTSSTSQTYQSLFNSALDECWFRQQEGNFI